MFWFKKKKHDSHQEQNEVDYYKRANQDIFESEVKASKSSCPEQIEMSSNSSGNEDTVLHFDNLNFKLAIIEVLMYDLELLKPTFNIFDFANAHNEKEIDTESMEIIQPAFDFFQELQIPASLAPYVESIYMDGGNETYMNIIPQWDGEDDVFDLNDVTLTELKQFPNLRTATIMSSNYEHVKAVFSVAGVEVEQL